VEVAVSAPRVLVTGGSGFIGQHLVGRLRSEGVEVVVADKVPHPDPTVPYVGGDLCDRDVVEAAVAGGTEVIYHLAAMTSVLGSVQRPREVYETNVAMTAALLERGRAVGVSHFVLASTNAVVGAGLNGADPATTPISETTPLRPLTPYGGTKAAGEMLACAYAGAYGMGACSVRLTNIYGPGMSGKDSVIPRLMRAALSGRGLSVYGDGLQRRDYLHVSDAVQALVLAAKVPEPGPLVVGTGRSTSVLDLLEAARQVTGRPIPANHVDPKPGEMAAVVVDTSRARSYGFHPAVDLLDGLAGTWTDFQAREG
jgi:UDP-glucose 4-epimerase